MFFQSFAVLLAQSLPLPPRPADAPAGNDFAAQIASVDPARREEEVCRQVLSGNVPNSFRKFCPVNISEVIDANTNQCTYYVSPDYLAVGSDDDYLLMPLSPNSAQRLADALDCILPTRKMADQIYAAAEVKLAPAPIPPSASMTTVALFSNHNAMVRSQRAESLDQHPLGALVAGHKKDVVITPRLKRWPGKVAIYGWHQTNGAPIQPLYLGHTAAWVDYSQCIRLVSQQMLLNGEPTRVETVLQDPERSTLLSDEGPVTSPRYPTNSLPGPRPQLPAQETASNNTGFSGFEPSRFFGEQTASFRLTNDVEVHVNMPGQDSFRPGRKVLLIFYALPNGSTIAQTIGRTLKPGDDWHFDIQHIGAQTRFLRQVLTNQTVVIAYLANTLNSWPAWRKQHGDTTIPDIIAEIARLPGVGHPRIVLSGHSGGGSFIFGYLNCVDRIPSQVERIAFLDSNYAYDHALHHDAKLAAWLNADSNHTLCILAYNDAVALLNGKSFVSAKGGTWGKSHEMQSDLVKFFAFTARTNGGFEIYSALNGRLQFLLKENPNRKILHTVQVERNGFIHAMLSGTDRENFGYEYFGSRAYAHLIHTE